MGVPLPLLLRAQVRRLGSRYHGLNAASLGRLPPCWSCQARNSHSFSPSNIASLLTRRPSLSQFQPKSGETLTVNGFVQTVRKQKRVAFAAIGDGSCLQTLQVVLSPDQADGLSTGAAVAITGEWKSSPCGKEQSHELHASQVRILGEHDATTYPIQKKYQTQEFLRTIPHLRSRLPSNALLLRLRSQVIAQLTKFFSSEDFVQTHPPIITSSDCEGAGEVFSITSGSNLGGVTEQTSAANDGNHFFQSPKYLTVSTQLHLEALAQSVGRVWSLSPTFRAEKSDTPRHLSEFYMLEAEVVFTGGLGQVMDLVENMLRETTQGITSSPLGNELLAARENDKNNESEGPAVTASTLARRWQGLIDGPWPRITYKDAIKHLQEAVSQAKVEFAFAPSYEGGLQTEHERYLAESLGRDGPVFVTDYPREIKPFYMAPSPGTVDPTDPGSTVACFDLLVPDICELVGGSLREHRLPELSRSMEQHGLKQPSATDPNNSEQSHALQWYMDLRRYGSVPHGGFGVGFDRLLCYLSGVSNIREVVSFPRWHGRCDC